MGPKKGLKKAEERPPGKLLTLKAARVFFYAVSDMYGTGLTKAEFHMSEKLMPDPKEADKDQVVAIRVTDFRWCQFFDNVKHPEVRITVDPDWVGRESESIQQVEEYRTLEEFAAAYELEPPVTVYF